MHDFIAKLWYLHLVILRKLGWADWTLYDNKQIEKNAVQS